MCSALGANRRVQPRTILCIKYLVVCMLVVVVDLIDLLRKPTLAMRVPFLLRLHKLLGLSLYLVDLFPLPFFSSYISRDLSFLLIVFVLSSSISIFCINSLTLSSGLRPRLARVKFLCRITDEISGGKIYLPLSVEVHQQSLSPKQVDTLDHTR